MLETIGRRAEPGTGLSRLEISEIVASACVRDDYRGKRILLIVPDGTRTAPVGAPFQTLHQQLAEVTKSFDVLIALGTHQPMSDEGICRRLEISGTERREVYGRVKFFNHSRNKPDALKQIGTLSSKEVSELTGGLFAMDVPVEINRMLFDYDQVIIAGPVFPHEVVGFSGGNKYLFPGVPAQ
jgi:nickel-dependent lactate racemase